MLLFLPAVAAADGLVMAAVIHQLLLMYIAVAAAVLEVVQVEVAVVAEYWALVADRLHHTGILPAFPRQNNKPTLASVKRGFHGKHESIN